MKLLLTLKKVSRRGQPILRKRVNWRKGQLLTAIAVVLAVMALFVLPPYLASAVTLIIRPNAAGDEASLTPVGAASNWDCVDEATSDENTTYVESLNLDTYSTDLYNLADAIVSGNLSGKGKINSVTVYIRARVLQAATQPSAYTRIKTGGVAYNGTAQTLTTAYADYSTAYTTNPQTGAEWTWLQLNNLQAGVGLRRGSTTGAAANRLSRATQVWVVVDYTAATLQSYQDAAHTTIWGESTSPYNSTYNTVYMYGPNYIKSHGYTVGYYDNAGTKVASISSPSAADNTLSSQYLLSTDPTAQAGTWHAVVFDDDFGAPSATYAAAPSSPGYMVEDPFDVASSAIPEFPTVITGIIVAGVCFGLYYWLRKKRLVYVKA